MPRNSGSPFSIRNWTIQILCPALSAYLRVKGLTELSYTTDADTRDGSGADDAWKEPYVYKRGAKLKLTGRPVYDPLTGAPDSGQAELDRRAAQLGFEGDATLRLIDPHGHAFQLDVIITEASRQADAEGQQISWSLELVGEPEILPYVQLTGLTILSGTTPATEVAIDQGDALELTVKPTPQNASNQKIAVLSADPTSVRVRSVDGLNFTLLGLQKTQSAVRVVVTSMNNAIEKTVLVNVR